MNDIKLAVLGSGGVGKSGRVSEVLNHLDFDLVNNVSTNERIDSYSSHRSIPDKAIYW